VFSTDSFPATVVKESLEQPPDPAVKPSELTRRGFLRAAAVTGTGLVAVGVAACAPAATGAAWSYGPSLAPAGAASPSAGAPSAAPSIDHASAAPSTAPSGAPAMDHDANALAVVERFLGGEGASLPGQGNVPLEPRVEGGVKIFDLTIEEMEHRIDAIKDPVQALGFNGTWPGPRLSVVEGDRVRATFTNKMKESTGIHFHGQKLPNNMDGVPHVTQDPIPPGGSFTYEFVARTPGSHMYHSHHNATDQVGRGLLGAFIVEPRRAAESYQRKYGVTQEVVFIHNDSLGGFTINGHGFPAVLPILAAVGERVRVRFMNEGIMYHPFHSHGYRQTVVARDGYPLGPNAYGADTITVGPGESWDVNIDVDRVGLWAFHCHILPHVEGADGMFGMVNVLIVVPTAADVDAIISALTAT
jgi:FtsP/CotA-like multicopper oxidase with cupredoxin domain